MSNLSRYIFWKTVNSNQELRNFLASHINSLGCGGLNLKIPDTRECYPTRKPSSALWFADIPNLNPAVVLNL